MKRRLFNAAAVLSLALCVAVSGVWVGSFWVTCEYYRVREDRNGNAWQSIRLQRGNLLLRWSYQEYINTPVGSGTVRWSLGPSSPRPIGKTNRLGFGYQGTNKTHDLGGAYILYALALPYWFLLLLNALLPLLWVRAYSKRRSW